MKRAAILLLSCALAACGAKSTNDTLQGYGEADYIYLSSQEAGVVSDVMVKEGDALQPGQQAFRLDPDRMHLSAQGATAQRAALADAVRAAEADAELAAQNLARGRQLTAGGFYPKARLDSDIAADDAARARLAQARRALAAASADSGLVERRVQDLVVTAPSQGFVQRVFHRPGEVVSPGEPVLSVLAPQNVKVRFFAPQADLARLHLGDLVAVSCDGCAQALKARVSFIATEPQFTPPVIYSLEERAKLVFLVEARPLDPSAITPGIPVDVRIPTQAAPTQETAP